MVQSAKHLLYMDENWNSDPGIASTLDTVLGTWDFRVGKTEKGVSLGLVSS